MKKIINNIFSHLINKLYKTDILALSKAIESTDEIEFFWPYYKFRLLYFHSSKLNTCTGVMVFFIDRSATITFFEFLNIRFHLKSSKNLYENRFHFLKNYKKFIPENIKRSNFIKFFFSELLSYPLQSISIVAFCSFLLLNININLIEKIISTNISIVTIFISIYLVFINLLYTNTTNTTDINYFFSGKYKKNHDDNKNMLYMALMSILFSVLALSIINLQLNDRLQLLQRIGSFIGRYNASIIITIISLLCTFICFINIVEYYLKSKMYDYYNHSINKIIEDQKGLQDKSINDPIDEYDKS